MYELQESTEYMNSKKDELIEAKRMAEIKSEELRKEYLAKEEIATKRLQ